MSSSTPTTCTGNYDCSCPPCEAAMRAEHEAECYAEGAWLRAARHCGEAIIVVASSYALCWTHRNTGAIRCRGTGAPTFAAPVPWQPAADKPAAAACVHGWLGCCDEKLAELPTATIARIDMNGLQGRDPHPGRELEGRKCYILEGLGREGSIEDGFPELYRVLVLDARVPATYVLADYELEGSHAAEPPELAAEEAARRAAERADNGLEPEPTADLENGPSSREIPDEWKRYANDVIAHELGDHRACAHGGMVPAPHMVGGSWQALEQPQPELVHGVRGGYLGSPENDLEVHEPEATDADRLEAEGLADKVARGDMSYEAAAMRLAARLPREDASDQAAAYRWAENMLDSLLSNVESHAQAEKGAQLVQLVMPADVAAEALEALRHRHAELADPRGMAQMYQLDELLAKLPALEAAAVALEDALDTHEDHRAS